MDYSSFEYLLKLNNTTAYRVAKATNIPNSTFTDWKNGRSSPKLVKLKKIADYFGISLETLLKSNFEEKENCIDSIYLTTSKMVPVINEINFGLPIVREETLIGKEMIDVNDASDYFFLKIHDDSMKGSGIFDSSIVLFHKQSYAESGDIVVCTVNNNDAIIRRLKKIEKYIVLIPENDNYSELKLSIDDCKSGNLRILGVALEVRIIL